MTLFVLNATMSGFPLHTRPSKLRCGHSHTRWGSKTQMGNWDYLDDEYAEEETFQPIRKAKMQDDNYMEYNASNRKDTERKMWARSRKMKEFPGVSDDVSET